jgi:hypothetical protein
MLKNPSGILVDLQRLFFYSFFFFHFSFFISFCADHADWRGFFSANICEKWQAPGRSGRPNLLSKIGKFFPE